MSFVSEPVCMPRCPAVETWFQGSESLLRISFSSGTRGSHEGSSVTVWSAVWNAGVFRLYLSLYLSQAFSKCLSVCLVFSYSLCLFSPDFLTVLICRKTHEYMRPLWNLMDLEWTWDVATLRHFKHQFGFICCLDRWFLLQYFYLVLLVNYTETINTFV